MSTRGKCDDKVIGVSEKKETKAGLGHRLLHIQKCWTAKIRRCQNLGTPFQQRIWSQNLNAEMEQVSSFVSRIIGRLHVGERIRPIGKTDHTHHVLDQCTGTLLVHLCSKMPSAFGSRSLPSLILLLNRLLNPGGPCSSSGLCQIIQEYRWR